MPEERHRVYVLRLWDEPAAPHGHRISLYDALSGDRRYFGTPQALLAYLNILLGDPQYPHPPHLRS